MQPHLSDRLRRAAAEATYDAMAGRQLGFPMRAAQLDSFAALLEEAALQLDALSDIEPQGLEEGMNDE